MGLWIGVAVLAALLYWVFMPRRRSMPSPEYEDKVPIDRVELEQAERELRQDPRPRSLQDGVNDDEDDWGPGTA